MSWVGSVSAIKVAFFKAQNPRFEDQIETFPCSFPGLTFGKLLSLLKARKTPIILGWFHTDFFLLSCFSIPTLPYKISIDNHQRE
jgi:hypothetical protein